MIDIHSHILPGIDDGPQDMETALKMCRMAARDGITAIAATPHCMNGVFAPQKSEILEACAGLNRSLAEEGIGLEIVPGMEMHLTPDIIERIDRNEVLSYADAGEHILVEPSFFAPPPQFKDRIFDIMLRNLRPVIAHVERLPYMHGEYELIKELRDMGALVQLTSGSITGRFGPEARKSALGIIKRGLADAVSSDAHSPNTRRPLLSKAFTAVKNAFGPDTAEFLFVTNPARIIAQNGQ